MGTVTLLIVGQFAPDLTVYSLTEPDGTLRLPVLEFRVSNHDSNCFQGNVGNGKSSPWYNVAVGVL